MKGRCRRSGNRFSATTWREYRATPVLFLFEFSFESPEADYDAQFVDKQFQDAWKKADVQLKLEDLV